MHFNGVVNYDVGDKRVKMAIPRLRRVGKLSLPLQGKDRLAQSVAVTRVLTGLDVVELSVQAMKQYRQQLHLTLLSKGCRVWVEKHMLLTLCVHGHRLDPELAGQTATLFNIRNMCGKNPIFIRQIESLRANGKLLDKDAPVGPARRMAHVLKPVSYTHLTLPTKRIV